MINYEVLDATRALTIARSLESYSPPFKIIGGYKLIDNGVDPEATVQIEANGTSIHEASTGNGPVDATFAAIRKITKTNYQLLRYAVNAITGGSDAQGEVTVQLKYNGHSVVGRGAHPDVIVASAKAYINALNRLEFLKDNAKKAKVVE